MRRYTQTRYRTYKRLLLWVAGALVLIIAALGWIALRPTPRPVPAHIAQQVRFSVLYPKRDFSIDQTSWQYLSSQASLSFTARKDGFSVIFTEQQVPLAYQDDVPAYDRFIGSLRPFATFNVGLGTVSLVDFVTTSDFQPAGQAGILDAKGTLLLAHPDRELSDNEWRDIFTSLGN